MLLAKTYGDVFICYSYVENSWLIFPDTVYNFWSNHADRENNRQRDKYTNKQTNKPRKT